MARKNLDAKFEVIQDTLTNPQYESKLARILIEMTPIVVPGIELAVGGLFFGAK